MSPRQSPKPRISPVLSLLVAPGQDLGHVRTASRRGADTQPNSIPLWNEGRHVGASVAVARPSVEDRLGQDLIPLAERCGRVMREALAALEATREPGGRTIRSQPPRRTRPGSR